MTVHLEIPESIARSLRIPAPEIAPRLRTELAVALYSQELLSFGRASELADVSRYRFTELLAHREIPRHYTDEELQRFAF